MISRMPDGYARRVGSVWSVGDYDRRVPNSIVCLSFDFDALSVWFGYERTTPAMLNRGEYGARVGVPRLLDLLDRHDIQATFFVPGHTVDSFPDETAAILERGHEVAAHSYAHVDPSRQAPDEERADMDRALAALEKVGVAPLGYRSPSSDLSGSTLALVEEYGFVYDSSLMTDDFRPFHPRIGDRVSRDEPLVRGRESRLWELPMCFELDDWPLFQFNFDPPAPRTGRARRGARDLAGRARLDGRQRRRRRPHRLHAPPGDRSRPSRRDARAIHRARADAQRALSDARGRCGGVGHRLTTGPTTRQDAFR
jgi:hypothetical protein